MSTPTCKTTPPADDCQCCGNAFHQCICSCVFDDVDYELGGCGMCDGAGSIDGYEDDPNWYEPGEVKPCPQCGGTGA